MLTMLFGLFITTDFLVITIRNRFNERSIVTYLHRMGSDAIVMNDTFMVKCLFVLPGKVDGNVYCDTFIQITTSMVTYLSP